jgi:hypothetical protein
MQVFAVDCEADAEHTPSTSVSAMCSSGGAAVNWLRSEFPLRLFIGSSFFLLINAGTVRIQPVVLPIGPMLQI